jgi:hypothetical protein
MRNQLFGEDEIMDEFSVDQFPGKYSVDIRFTFATPELMGRFIDAVMYNADRYDVDVSYPVMEAMVVPDLDNGGGG